MSIIQLKRRHLKPLAQLHQKVFNLEPWNENWSYQSSFRRLKNIYKTPGFMGCIFCEKGEVRGAVFGYVEYFSSYKSFYLVEFFVNPNCQNQGIGKQLLRHLEIHLEKNGIATIYLLSKAGSSASLFYKKNSFKVMEDLKVFGKKVRSK